MQWLCLLCLLQQVHAYVIPLSPSNSRSPRNLILSNAAATTEPVPIATLQEAVEQIPAAAEPVRLDRETATVIQAYMNANHKADLLEYVLGKPLGWPNRLLLKVALSRVLS